MIGQYLSNNNETATVAFRQKFCQLNSLLVDPQLDNIYQIRRKQYYSSSSFLLQSKRGARTRMPDPYAEFQFQFLTSQSECRQTTTTGKN
jgi:hypothetical protein